MAFLYQHSSAGSDKREVNTVYSNGKSVTCTKIGLYGGRNIFLVKGGEYATFIAVL